MSSATLHLEKALDLAGGIEGEDPIAIEAAAALGSHNAWSYERREQLLRRVLEIRARDLGRDHADTLLAMGTLSRVLRSQRKYGEAEALDREILAKRTAALGPEHPDTLRAMNSLAGVLYGTARFGEAANLYEEALEISRRRPGPDHPDTLRLASNLGSTYSVLGRYLEAEPLQQAVVDQRLEVLGGEHHQTGMSMHNLGTLLLRLGRYEEAESWFRRAVGAREKQGGAGYYYSKSFLADALRELGRFEEAEALYLEALGEQASDQPEHPDNLRTAASLAELHFLRGDLVVAEEMALGALEEQLRIEGHKVLDATETLLLLASIRSREGRFEEAAAFALRSQQIAEDTLGREHPTALHSRLERCRALLAAGDRESAQVGLVGLQDALEVRLGADHALVREARSLIAATG
jgi:tetratricopeptide (TPR) repeat protein